MKSGTIRKTLDLMSDGSALWALMTWPHFSLTSYRMVASLAKQENLPRTVIDVGANVGQFTVAVSKLFDEPDVFAFEPLPDCYPTLATHSARFPRVRVFQLAIGEAEQTVKFHVNRHRHSSSILPLAQAHRDAFPSATETGCIDVIMSTLDKQLGDVVMRSPILLKLDVQGYESNVLAGARDILMRIDQVVLETSFKPLYENELTFLKMIDLMEGFGFRFARPVGFLESQTNGEILQMDALFVPNR